MRWTQALMRQVAAEERAGLGLSWSDRFDPHALAAEHAILIFSIDELADDDASQAAVEHFTVHRPDAWSAALIAIGRRRIILENPVHARVRRRSNIAHELGHFLLEHPLEPITLTDGGCRAVDAGKEREAAFLAGELLIPTEAALKMAFAGRTNAQVARRYGVSTQFAQMRMSGARVHAARARAKQAAATARSGGAA